MTGDWATKIRYTFDFRDFETKFRIGTYDFLIIFNNYLNIIANVQ